MQSEDEAISSTSPHQRSGVPQLSQVHRNYSHSSTSSVQEATRYQHRRSAWANNPQTQRSRQNYAPDRNSTFGPPLGKLAPRRGNTTAEPITLPSPVFKGTSFYSQRGAKLEVSNIEGNPGPSNYRTASATIRTVHKSTESEACGNLKTCTICLEVYPSISGYPRDRITNTCTHEPTACLTCVATSIRTNLETAGYNHIRCLECNADMSHADVIKFADERSRERKVHSISFMQVRTLKQATLIFQCRYDRLVVRGILSISPNFIWCQGVNCEAGQYHSGGADQPIVTCITCGFRTCFQHKTAWHDDLTCNEYDEFLKNPDGFQPKRAETKRRRKSRGKGSQERAQAKIEARRAKVSA